MESSVFLLVDKQIRIETLAHHVKKSQRAEVALWCHRWHVESLEGECLDLEVRRRKGVPWPRLLTIAESACIPVGER
jgi:hypothetical protein